MTSIVAFGRVFLKLLGRRKWIFYFLDCFRFIAILFDYLGIELLCIRIVVDVHFVLNFGNLWCEMHLVPLRYLTKLVNFIVEIEKGLLDLVSFLFLLSCESLLLFDDSFPPFLLSDDLGLISLGAVGSLEVVQKLHRLGRIHQPEVAKALLPKTLLELAALVRA